MKKTNAARLCDQLKIAYSLLPYEGNQGFLDGVAVADLLGIPYTDIFKTLVTIGSSGRLYVFVIPVHLHLHLKKAALASKEKSIDLLKSDLLFKHTGYIKGGCSPIGMRKNYPTYFDHSLLKLKHITFNAGMIGLQIRLPVSDLDKVISYSIADVCDAQEKDGHNV